MGGMTGAPSSEVLRALAERELIFELMAHPDQLEEAAAAFAAHPELTIAVEHAGWPRSELETHLREEHSTFTWLFEPMLAQAGFTISEAGYTPSRTHASYTCVLGD